MLQNVTNRSSEVGFHKAKKKEKKRAGEAGRIIFRPTVYITYDQIIFDRYFRVHAYCTDSNAVFHAQSEYIIRLRI